jgi:hypothetical protein
MSDKPKLNFLAYVFMMYQSGLISLGKAENPVTRKTRVEPEEAKGIIGILEILEEKTSGNLTKEEERTLKMVIDSLRFAFVEQTGGKKPSKETEKPKENQGQDKGKDGEDIEVH